MCVLFKNRNKHRLWSSLELQSMLIANFVRKILRGRFPAISERLQCVWCRCTQNDELQRGGNRVKSTFHYLHTF